MDEEKLRLLRETGHHYSVPRGVSMYPMLKHTESVVDIVPCKGRLKKYDVALYWCEKAQKCVLHRVLSVCADGYVFYGDNCWRKETVPDEAIMGVAVRFKRDAASDWTSVTDRKYRLYVHLWCDLLPLRRLLLWCKEKIWRKWGKGRNAA